MIGVLAAVFLMSADSVVPVSCGQDLDAIVNADDPMIGTRFQLEGPCTYPVDTTVVLNEGDEIAGPQATFIERPPAFDPEPIVTIVGSEGLSNVIRARGTVHLEWVKIAGGTGQYLGGSPLAGTGSALAMGMASNDSSLYAVHITGSDATGISNAHGTFERIELDDTTQDPNFLGFVGSGLKAINEIEIRNSYVHDNQGNGIWCDDFCHDSASHLNGFWVRDNLVVNNGFNGIRFERVGDVADAGEALIENNEVHGNSLKLKVPRGGIDIRDAQNALVRHNVFGKKTIANVAYTPNSNNLAIRATDSGRSDRPDLWNVDIVGNVLNGETIVGCELSDEIVDCSDTDTTGVPTVLSTIPDANATGVDPIATATAFFSEEMMATSINTTTFKLTKKGSTTKVAAEVKYFPDDPATAKLDPRATLDPNSALLKGVTYKAVVTTGAKDTLGNPLDQNPTTTGLQQKAWYFTVRK